MVYEVETCRGPDDSTCYKPKRIKSSPGILLLHGSEGGSSGWNHVSAIKLAQYGFFTYPFSYSVNSDWWHAGDIENVELDKTEKALIKLKNEICPGQKIGLYGVSRGGEHALLLTCLIASKKAQEGLPDAVAVHAPSDVFFSAFKAVWTYDNEPVSFDPAAIAWTWRGRGKNILPSTPIHIEKYSGPLYISHGTEDSIWPCEMTRNLERRLLSAGRSPEIHYYEEQDHIFDPFTENIHYKRIVDFFAKHHKKKYGIEEMKWELRIFFKGGSLFKHRTIFLS